MVKVFKCYVCGEVRILEKKGTEPVFLTAEEAKERYFEKWTAERCVRCGLYEKKVEIDITSEEEDSDSDVEFEKAQAERERMRVRAKYIAKKRGLSPPEDTDYEDDAYKTDSDEDMFPENLL